MASERARTAAGALLLLGAAPLLAVGGDGPPPADFRHDVLPILARQGCASAYCHGSATGRGGFKLSLFGSDPRADHMAIAFDLDGRRLDRVEPARSLLLRKATRALPHEGGRRIEPGSGAYDALRRWIELGAPFGGEGRELTGLALERGGADALRVTAVFATGDGEERRDVTALATFDSSDPRVAAVDPDGTLVVGGQGRAWVFARYAGRSARLEVVRPFADPCGERAADHPLDAAWLASLGELGLEPGPEAPAHALCRRLYVDLAGRLPTAAEAAAFADAPAATRVAATARALLAGPAFADVFAGHLAAMLELDGGPPNARGRNEALRRRVRDALARGEPLDETLLALVEPGSGWLVRLGDPRDRAELFGRALLGIRIGCARCHDHPLDRWRRDEHLRFAALFGDPRPAPGGGMMAGRLFDDDGRAVVPALLPLSSATPPAGDATARLRWLAAQRDHGALARNLANRVLAALLGRGPVEPVDDHRATNPARDERLLRAAADLLVASGYDLRALVAAIATSRPYSASSEPGGDGTRYFARREARPLDGPLRRRLIAQALDVPPAADDRAPSPLADELALLNGELLRTSLWRGGTAVDAWYDFLPAEERADTLWLALLARRPTAAERALASEHARDRDAWRRLAFAVLCSREFTSIR